MAIRKRTKQEGFIGLQLSPELLQKLDERVEKVKQETGSGTRSSICRLALIEYLNKE